jgi:peptide deformylase
MVLPIYLYGDPIFKRPVKRVEKVDDKFIELLRNMFDTMKNADGIGLAATQVGISLSVAVIDISVIEEHRDFKPMAIINPEIIESSGEEIMEEGCLSIPGIRADVLRPSRVILRYFDLDMKINEIEGEGLLARVFQHEVDHLNGKFFIDHLSPIKLKILKPKLSKVRKGKVNPPYPVVIPGTGRVIYPQGEEIHNKTI